MRKPNRLLLTLLSSLTISAALLPMSSYAGWVQTGNAWRWEENGSYAVHWRYLDNNWYFFDNAGYMCTDWRMVDGLWYMFAPDGHMVTGWHTENGRWYYLGDDGALLTNTYTPDGYFVDENGRWIPDAPSKNDHDSELTSEVLRLVNEARKHAGLRALTRNEDLDRVAEVRANEIVEVFSHTRPDGSSCFTAFEENDYTDYLFAAENIAAGYSSAQEVMDGWMNSDGHRRNILNSDASEIGISAVRVNGRYYWVQSFGG